MAIYVSAGHTPKGLRQDPGAVGNGYREADLAMEFRDLVIGHLKNSGAKIIKDQDDERLGDYLKRIQTGNGSVVIEYHFDAAASSTATGTTALIEAEADRLDKAFGKELVEATTLILGIKNRGVLTEKDSHRGSLGLMREEGIICLMEICFISNKDDLISYQKNKAVLAKSHAEIILKYENMIK
jgi:N-acetylmuramoyl-L-alanine amidase